MRKIVLGSLLTFCLIVGLTVSSFASTFIYKINYNGREYLQCEKSITAEGCRNLEKQIKITTDTNVNIDTLIGPPAPIGEDTYKFECILK